MKEFVVLADNRSNNTELLSEHGLSVYVETENHKLLLDTGKSNIFLMNAQKLGIHLEDVDYVFISHGHNDHIGGLPFFLQINKKAKVIVSSLVPQQQYFSKRKYLHSITGDTNFEDYNNRFIFVDSNCTIDDLKIYQSLSHEYPLPQGNKNLYLKLNQEYIADEFHHELVLQTSDFLFTGCAHHGILNILNSIDNIPKICIGGLHLLDSHLNEHYETDNELQALAQTLNDNFPDIIFYTGHCTGDHSYSIMKNILGEKIQQFSCGTQKIHKLKNL